MLLIIGVSFFPLGLLSFIGLFMIIFPNAALMIQNYNASMGGSIFDNSLEFTDVAIMVTRIMGFVFIGAGIGIFLLINEFITF